MSNIIEQIQTIPNESLVYIQVIHQKAEGEGFVMSRHYTIPISVKQLKRLAKVEPTVWERFKEWWTNLITKSR
jgi:hypothetical protein